jgi:hypothetical protein
MKRRAKEFVDHAAAVVLSGSGPLTTGLRMPALSPVKTIPFEQTVLEKFTEIESGHQATSSQPRSSVRMPPGRKPPAGCLVARARPARSIPKKANKASH